MHLDPTLFRRQFAAGDVFAYPTEAVFGLGCDPQNQAAMEKILDLKQRPVEKGVILIAGEIQQLNGYVDFEQLSTSNFDKIKATWPGPFTYLVPKGAKTPAWICGNNPLVAVRVTQHPLVRTLCQTVNSPLVSTSANPAGQTPATSKEMVKAYFGERVRLLEGDLGNQQKPSTIINAVTMDTIR
ncbi:Sua5/YciO/YrdC/YwlC family protein [Glaciecola sp. 1036]|uniref:Sua5/YciO/YrdC/YwlC family protein n=1 Tax=Alteromonadaceae TaxID=72275 RepID=UPI003D018F70